MFLVFCFDFTLFRSRFPPPLPRRPTPSPFRSLPPDRKWLRGALACVILYPGREPSRQRRVLCQLRLPKQAAAPAFALRAESLSLLQQRWVLWISCGVSKGARIQARLCLHVTLVGKFSFCWACRSIVVVPVSGHLVKNTVKRDGPREAPQKQLRKATPKAPRDSPRKPGESPVKACAWSCRPWPRWERAFGGSPVRFFLELTD